MIMHSWGMSLYSVSVQLSFAGKRGGLEKLNAIGQSFPGSYGIKYKRYQQITWSCFFVLLLPQTEERRKIDALITSGKEEGMKVTAMLT